MKRLLLPTLLGLPFLLHASVEADVQELEILSSADVPERAQAEVEELAWIAGHWRGQGLGGICEEIWSPPLGDSMMGMFRVIQDEGVDFYELMTLVPDEKSVLLRLKHFHADLKGWEEKDDRVEFPLLALDDQTAWFDGLTMQREKNRLIVLVLAEGNRLRFEYEAM